MLKSSFYSNNLTILNFVFAKSHNMKVRSFILLSIVISGISSDVFRNDMKNGYCSIPKFEDINQFLSGKGDCSKVNQLYDSNENYNFINYFGQNFNLLKKTVDSLVVPKNNNKIDAVFFVGNTGVGKSTLVQILGGNNSKIFSKSVNNDSSDFIIVDNGLKIGMDTITSETLYPELLVDKETGYFLCDNPGFRDTRSPIHEIISMYSIKKILKHTDKIKIVIVITHASLKVGMYKEDFPNLLKHLTELIHDVDKYKESIHIIATKVENVYRSRQGKIEMVSDSTVISGIASYLMDVKTSLSEKIKHQSTSKNMGNYNNSIKIIDNLLAKKNNTFMKINIIRRPDDEGPISDIEILQTERTNIRKMLLTNENFVKVNSSDFGIPLTDSSLIFLNDLFAKMNSYIAELSKLISLYMINHYEPYIKSINNINSVIQNSIHTKEKVKKFSVEIGKSKNPGEYIDKVNNFTTENNLQLDCFSNFKNLSALNEFLVNLNDFLNTTAYTPLTWNMSMYLVNDFFDKKVEEYSFLKDVFGLLSSYKVQQNINMYNVKDLQHWGIRESKQGLEINENNFNIFIEKCNLQNRYRLVEPNSVLMHNINSLIKLSIKHQNLITCQNKIVTVIDYFITFSKLEDKLLQNCKDAVQIKIFALHSVFIDRDLISGWYNGKEITIIAPVWNVIGSRKISVNGAEGGNPLPKASVSQVGSNGHNGLPGGKIFGIGEFFNNGENLFLSASGGNGQNGQDGGDGLDGSNGANGNENHNDGEYGGTGGNSGEGGKGGLGGKKGLIILHNIGKSDHRVNIIANDGKQGVMGRDGKPGRGGVKGCDLKIRKEKHRFLGIRIRTSTYKEFVNCGAKSPDGHVQRANIPVSPSHPKNYHSSLICEYIMNFRDYQMKNYNSILSDGTSPMFINHMISSNFEFLDQLRKTK
ncbi:uncharacterized protein LOC142329668 [Lycorma delicatula]|uniref:uncharacterized protein LOC142329668 n=1 Tax=Lycorma delicatula TaxID=130591 RepID=UPI003F518655